MGVRTLLSEWPEPRSTNDLDLYLRPELLTESAKLKPLAEAITRLGYQVVSGAEKYQFVEPGPGGIGAGSIKIDILTGPQSRFKGTKVKTDDRRARPNPSIGIHAHPVDEAPTLEEGLLSELLTGNSVLASPGKPRSSSRILTFLMMKLFAFRDRCDDADKESAATMPWICTPSWRRQWKRNGTRPSNSEIDKEKNRLSWKQETWSRNTSPPVPLGMIRLRESRYYRPQLQLDEFMSALQELFPVRGKAAS